MAEERTLEALLPNEGTSDFQIELAGLSGAAQQQAQQVVEQAAANGTLIDLDLDEVISNARDADAARERAEDLQVEQAKATAEGDFGRAEELSVQAEYELKVVEEKGDEPIHAAEAIEHADQDQSDLQFAEYHAEIAGDNADAAAAYAAEGDFDHAADYSDAAADHAGAAGDFSGAEDTVTQAEQHDAADAGAEAV
jgi:hypothetical protein